MTNTTLIAKSTWHDGRVDIHTIIYTADEMAEIFLPEEREELSRGEVVERGSHGGIRYIDAKAVALKAGL